LPPPAATRRPRIFTDSFTGTKSAPRCSTAARCGSRGEASVENPVHVHDLQATILHLLGINHEQLTYRHAGRDYRLTDVAGKVVKEIIS
jgi:hypothetical protein